MNEKFKKIVDEQSRIVDAIIDKAMFHANKDAARRFLRLMDHYICFYLNRDNGGLCFPIIRIPSRPSWVREVLLKYLIYRIAIYYNGDSLEHLKPTRQIILEYEDPTDKWKARTARRKNDYKRKWEEYKKRISELFNNQLEYIGETGHKNLIFCSPGDLTVSRDSKNEFIDEFYGKPDDIFSEKNVCLCHNLKSKDIRQKLKGHKQEVLIDNIFVLYTNNDKCESLRKMSIEKLNRDCNTGIKNCFIFDFTDHPYRLAETLLRDKKLSFIYPELNERQYQENEYFTVLNDEETKYLFSPTIESVGESEHLHIKDYESGHIFYFKPLIGTFTDEAEYWVQERNNFSLCLSDNLMDVYKKRLKGFTTDMDENIYDYSFVVQKMYAKKILDEISDRIDRDQIGRIALVVDYYLPKEMQRLLPTLFPQCSVKVYSYESLKPKRNGKKRLLGNSIKEKFVVVFRYRPHNAKSAFARYPNSFDAFTTNPGQYIIEIIQDYVFVDKFLWDKYEYELLEYKYFNSIYRKEALDCIARPQKPEIPQIPGNEDPDEEKPIGRQNGETLEIQYENGTSARMAESEKVIYQTDEGEIDIARLKDLRGAEILNHVTAIQRLDEITEVLYQAIIEKEKETTDIEKHIRQSCYEKGLISEEERNSDVYLWRIFLKKKIEVYSSDKKVYDEIMEPLNISNRIQYNAFKHWADTENSMMLPLQKATQKRLMEYLGLSPAYLSVMRSKKMAEKNRTRNNNAMLENFLADYLFINIDEDAFEEFKDSPINEILQCESVGDLQALVDILGEKISLNTINNTIR